MINVKTINSIFRKGKYFMPIGRNVRIGDLLVEKNLITPQQVESALKYQKEKGNGKRLGIILVELGYVKDVDLAKALAENLRVQYVDLASIQINKDAVNKVSEEMAKEKMCFAYQFQNNRLYVATDDPVNFMYSTTLKFRRAWTLFRELPPARR